MEDTTEKTAEEKSGVTNNINNNENAIVATPDQKKNQVSQRQKEHLEYARQMKKIKQDQRKHEVETRDRSLNLINQRLTNIENNVNNLVDKSFSLKRSRRQLDDDSEDWERPTKRQSKKKAAAEKGENQNRSYFYDNVLPMVGKTVFVGIAGFFFSLVKQKLTQERRTNDGDTINGYYIGENN